MNILFDIPRYLPYKDGAIMMVKDYREAMTARGHEVKLTCLDGQKDGGPELYDWADVVISHLGRAPRSQTTAASWEKPFIWLKHSAQFEIDAPTIYNSNWLAEAQTETSVGSSVDHTDTTVCYPICNYDEFQDQSEGAYITLIGLNPNKGGLLLGDLARSMPGHRFIGVCGAYGGQEVHHLPRNVKLVQHPCYINKVLKDTKILLVMSEHESFSRCTAEAMSMGVPVISTNTKGVAECGSHGAYYLEGPRENIFCWQDAIEDVSNNLIYWKQKSRSRAAELQALTEEHITNFETICYENCKDKSTEAVPAT